MGWLIWLAVLVGLAVLPLGICVRYNGDGPRGELIVGPLRFRLFPRKKKEKKPKKEKRPRKAAAQKAAPQEDATQETGGSIWDFMTLMDVLIRFLGEFRRKLRIDRLELLLIMAGDDPCDLAVNYGKAWAAVGNVFPLLEQVFVIKKRDVQLRCDFTAEQMLVIARLDLTLTLGRLISLAVRHGSRAVREYLKILKLRKGGAMK